MSESREWDVRWVMQVEAKDAETAAKKARVTMLNPRSIATVYEVDKEMVDLEDLRDGIWGSRIALADVVERLTRDLSVAEMVELTSLLIDELAGRARRDERDYQ